MSEETFSVIGKRKATVLAMVGALIAAVLDTAVHPDPLCSKFGLALHTLFGFTKFLALETVGALFVIACAGGIAYLNQFKSELGAASAGLMIFTTLSTYMPVTQDTSVNQVSFFEDSRGTNSTALQPVADFRAPYALNASPAVFSPSTVKLWYIAGDDLRVDATANRELWVSTCKPSYYGLFGLGSFINNSIRTCPAKVTVAPDTHLEVLRRWKTLARSYHYVEVKFATGDKTVTGWIPAGTSGDPWLYLDVPADSAARDIKVEW